MGGKTLWEKEKMLATSIFSFSHYVFQRLLFQGRCKWGLRDKGIIQSEKIDCPYSSKSFWKFNTIQVTVFKIHQTTMYMYMNIIHHCSRQLENLEQKGVT